MIAKLPTFCQHIFELRTNPPIYVFCPLKTA